MRVLRIAGVVVAVLAIVVVAAFLWYRQASQPVHEGTVRVPALKQSLRIERDAHGIPHIVASSELDAAFGLGYAHAQDRLWQMEINRRVAAGRLAEILGPAALDTDRFVRTLGLRRAAERIHANLDPETRALGEAYAAGVNAYLATRSGPLPAEFVLTRTAAPAPWHLVDSIGWSLIMAWDLARYSHTMELRRLVLSSRFSLAELNEILAPAQDERAPETADYVELYRLLGLRRAGEDEHRRASAEDAGFGFGDADTVGTNAWVVAGSRTVSGKPLLANDPHLGLSTPSLWYFAAMTAPGLAVTGSTLPGVPGVLLGRNDRVAWGFANTGVDQQDLYLERVRPDDPDEYETPAGWARFERRTETIHVKGEADVELTVRETRHGPVLSGLTAVDRALRHPGYVLALRWSALEPEDRSFAAVRALNKARSAADAEAALAQFQLVTQSAIFADVDGAIGMIVTGRIPRRRPDDDLRGIAPAPGWDERYDWNGYLPPDEVPRVRNPAAGAVVVANNRIVDDAYPHHLTYDWAPAYRARRIGQRLEERARHDATTFKAIQADVRSQAALDLIALLRDTRPVTEAGRDAIARLVRWDGAMAPDRPEPLVFHAWMRELKRRLFNDDFGPLAADHVDASERTMLLLRVLSGGAQARDWCDDGRTEHRVETCMAIAAEALDSAVTALTADSGRDVAGLRWGDAHIAVAEHRPFSAVPSLAALFELRTPYPGDTYTINVGALSHRSGAPFATRHAASLRAVYDLAAPDSNSYWVHSTGQSGSPFSDLYASMVAPWRDVRYLPMRAAAAPDAKVLLLQPRRP